ncbi:transposase IS204/IS1001/IS1096/IS1165 family protein, partial [mine drainage metagenome]
MNKVVIDQATKRVDVYIDHLKVPLNCPVCNLQCTVYDHLKERVWRDRDSIDFVTYVHSDPPRISCRIHGIIQVTIPWSERLSRFTTRFETHAIEVLQSTDVKKASSILGITWNEGWHIMDKAVKRGLSRKTWNPLVIGVDEKSYGKHHNYVTMVYNLIEPAVEYVSFNRKKASLNSYYILIG